MDWDDDWVSEEEGNISCGDEYSDDGGLTVMDDGDGEFIDKERRQVNYTALSKEDIRQQQEDAITKVCSVLSISRVYASLLLSQYQWCVSNVQEAWFADEERVRKTLGLLENPVVEFPNPKKKITCRICFNRYNGDNKFASAICGHLFCKECFSTYIRISVEDGNGCLRLKCPEPSCVAAITQDMVDSLVSDEVKAKYDHYLFRSFIENNKTMKWCPSPGCDNAVQFDLGSEVYDVYCLCLNGFCWNCGEDAHRPVDCETVSKWTTKNSLESENVNWLLANSKPCPKCRLPIEKNQGCMHMTCRAPCRFEFCWLCLGPWSEHGNNTGGYYECNKYAQAKQSGEINQEEEKRRMAKIHVEKYTHYFERWQSNGISRKKALSDLQEVQNVQIKKLSEIRAIPETQLQFIIDAWTQIVECRRVLKWTYAYGYYLSDDEMTKKRFFEYLQGEAEVGLERLHQCAEKNLNKYLKKEDAPSSSDFMDFRVKLVELTSITRTYFDNLVGALENGLSDVADEEVCRNTAKSSKKRKTKEKEGGRKKRTKDIDSD